MHQVQITKVNRPMVAVKPATPTGVCERGQQEKAHGSPALFCGELRKFPPAAGRKESTAQGSWYLALTMFSLKLQLQLSLSLLLILPNVTVGQHLSRCPHPRRPLQSSLHLEIDP